MSASSPAEDIIQWSKLPAVPDPNGFAGPFAGISNGALIVAGGANFPAGKPWEGGKKKWYDTIYILPENASEWTIAGRLPHATGYGVSITIPDGVLCVGGDNSDGAFSDAFLMKRNGGRVSAHEYPSLPARRTNLAGALLKDKVYVMGGIEQSSATAARKECWVLDLKDLKSGWQSFEPYPGPARMLAAAASVGGSIYLCSGAELNAGADGKPVRTYLRDAYRYTPGSGWKRVADLPRAAVAAPSPAPAMEPGDFFLLGGDDGSLASRPPGPDHPGFAKTILRYHAPTDTWTSFPNSTALPTVTAPAVPDGGRFIVPNGEIRPGVRTPEVAVLKFTAAESSSGAPK